MVAAGPVSRLLQEVANFPYNTTVHGVCEKLQPDGSCAVYENRPDVCNVELMYLKYFRKIGTMVDYFSLAAESCNAMIRAADLPEKYLITAYEKE